ncbi:MAG: RNA methyltransferase [Parcubacteria group bacterium]
MKKAARKGNIKAIVICHNIRSAHNAGSILRTADGAGVAKVYLTGYTPAPPHSGISKTALGAEETVEWEKISKPGELIEKLKKEDFEIIALELAEGSKPHYHFHPKRNIAIILGNEVRGISKGTLKKCDEIVSIPMRGKKESLNVSVAFGIAIYSFLR